MKKSNFYINLARNLASHRATGRTTCFLGGIEKFLAERPDAEKVYIIARTKHLAEVFAKKLNSIDNRSFNRVLAIDARSNIIGAETSCPVFVEHAAAEDLLLEAGRALELIELKNQELREILTKNNIPF